MPKLTEKGLRALKPQATRYDVREPGGFVCRVTPGGIKSLSTVYVRDGRKHRVTHGTWPAVTLEQAREKHLAVVTTLRRGENPAEVARKRRSGLTVEELVDQFLDQAVVRRTRKPKRPNTVKALRGNFARYVTPYVGAWKASAVTSSDIKELLSRADAHGPHARDGLLGALRVLWGWALEKELVEASPVAAIHRAAPESVRRRVLNEEELRVVWRGLEAQGDTGASRALRLILLTGCRPGEAAGMDWSEVTEELAGWWWTLPPERMKTDVGHRVPLTDQALALLGRRREAGPVFPRPALDGGAVYPDVLSRTLRAAQVGWGLREPVRPHDLRRSVASGLGKLGVREGVISRVLAHEVPGTTARHYNLFAYDGPRRKALERWSAHLEQVLRSEPGEVVRLRGAS